MIMQRYSRTILIAITAAVLISNMVLVYLSGISTKPSHINDYKAEMEMRKRAELVRLKCENRSLSSRHNWNRYIVTSNSKDYVYYPIAKCGWTSWIYTMFTHTGKEAELAKTDFKWGWYSPYELAGMTTLRRIALTKEFKERLLFVRNPYDRLVSAYKDKVLNTNYVYTLRTPCQWLREGMPKLSFPQFVECIIDVSRQNLRQRGNLSSLYAAVKLDVHWKPQFWMSLPCQTNYTLVGKFEHLSQDMQAAISILNLNSTVKHANAGTKYQDKTLAYWFNQLTPSVRLSVQELYNMDFEIFGFNNAIPS